MEPSLIKEIVVQDTTWLALVAEQVSNLAPLIALFGAIFLYFYQKRFERREELRRERQKVYINYLEALRSPPKLEEKSPILQEGYEVYKAVQPYHNVLTIIAPDNVVRASLKLVNLHIQSDINAAQGPVRGSKEFTKKIIENGFPIREARKELIRQMRFDVLLGTKISVDLTDVEDLK